MNLLTKTKRRSDPSEDVRRSLRGIAPREQPVLDWRTYGITRAEHAQLMAERRAFMVRLMQMPIDWTSLPMLQEQVGAYFGTEPHIVSVESDLKAIGAVRVPLKPGSRRTRFQLLEGHTPDSLMIEIHDRFAVDVLRVLRHETEVIIDTSRGVTQALHELLKLASADRLLPGYLYALHDGEDTVIIKCSTPGTAVEWTDRLKRVLAAARPKRAFEE
jgi:arginine repressor